eukprot:GEMP01055512.1.p1 GENE.GEMP01055512.1~~GEMP01055512.1.p1  ORF type:complete len:449 (+),score=93.38 GEMP01055512.1:41-1348(+)
MYAPSETESSCSEYSCEASVWGLNSDVPLHEYLGEVDRSLGFEASNLHDDWRLAGKGGNLTSYFQNIDDMPNPPNAPGALEFPPENIYEGYETADIVTLRRIVEQARFLHTRFQGELQARNEDLLSRDQRIKRLIKQKTKRFKPLQTANFQEMLQTRNTLDKAHMSLEEAKRELDKMEQAFVHVKLRYAELRSSEDELKLKVEFYEARLREQDDSFVPYIPVQKTKSSITMAKRRKDFMALWRSLRTKIPRRESARDCALDIERADSPTCSPVAKDDDENASTPGTPLKRRTTPPIIFPPGYQDRETSCSPSPRVSEETTTSTPAAAKTGEQKHGGSYFGKSFTNSFRARRNTNTCMSPTTSPTSSKSYAPIATGKAATKENVGGVKDEDEHLGDKMPEKSFSKSLKETIRTIGRRRTAATPATDAFHGDSVLDS